MNEHKEIFWGGIILAVFLASMAGAWYWTRPTVDQRIMDARVAVPALQEDHP